MTAPALASGNGRLRYVGEAHAAIDEARGVQADASAFQHLAVRVDADEAARAAGGEFENASGPGAKV